MPKAGSGFVLWTALRQIQAVREAVGDAVDAALCKSESRHPIEKSAFWWREQGVPEISNTTLATSEVILKCVYEQITKDTERSEDQLYEDSAGRRFGWAGDRGGERSSAHFTSPPFTFAITSGCIRLLGALESFEMDALKALLYYRPGGYPCGPEAEFEEREVERHVVLENPRKAEKNSNDEFYEKPVIWTWIRKPAENNEERRRILWRVYRIDCGASKSDNKERRDWYDKRNSIAHGRNKVDMLLGDYCKLEMLVIRTIYHIADECASRLKLQL
jgi:hypothetical protein